MRVRYERVRMNSDPRGSVWEPIIHSEEIAEGEAVQFVFPPNCPHAYKNIGDCPNLLVAFNTEAFDPSSPDGYPEVLIES